MNGWLGSVDGESLMAMGRDTRKEEKKNRPNINGEKGRQEANKRF
jgi:hypothetical protein